MKTGISSLTENSKVKSHSDLISIWNCNKRYFMETIRSNLNSNWNITPNGREKSKRNLQKTKLETHFITPEIQKLEVEIEEKNSCLKLCMEKKEVNCCPKIWREKLTIYLFLHII